MGAASRADSIAIVGGGIGGLCAAIGFLKKDIPTHVYEAAPAFAEIGAGVSFGFNSVTAMKMISPSIYEGFQRCETKNGYPEHAKHFFCYRRGQDKTSRTGSSMMNLTSKTGATSVHRAKFLDELIKEVPDSVASFGKRLDNIDDNGDHVVLHFQDGTTAKHAAVICCDGIKSRGREIVLGKDHPAAHATFSGKYAYRGLIPMDDAVKLLGDEIAQNAQWYLGYGSHMIHFPIEKGKTMNVVAFSTTDKWEDPQWIKPMDKEGMRKDFVGWIDVVQDVIDMMQKPDVWALFEMPPAPTYFKGRICLLGDAAHASTPHQGSGAGMAIEDALVLSNLLGDVFAGGSADKGGIEQAFTVYDKFRRPRTQKLVTTSRDMAELVEFQKLGILDDEDKIKENLLTRHDWIWYEDLDAHLAQAREALGAEQGSRPAL